MSRAGIPSSSPHNRAGKERVQDFLLEQIPKGEIAQARNGRWICTPCDVHLDTLHVLLIHREGKKHQQRMADLAERQRAKSGIYEEEEEVPLETATNPMFQPRVLKRKQEENNQGSRKRQHLEHPEDAPESMEQWNTTNEQDDPNANHPNLSQLSQEQAEDATSLDLKADQDIHLPLVTPRPTESKPPDPQSQPTPTQSLPNTTPQPECETLTEAKTFYQNVNEVAMDQPLY